MFGFSRSIGRETIYRSVEPYDDTNREALVHLPSKETKLAERVLEIVKDARFEAEANAGDVLSIVLSPELGPIPNAADLRTEMATFNDGELDILIVDTLQDGDDVIADVQLI